MIKYVKKKKFKEIHKEKSNKQINNALLKIKRFNIKCYKSISCNKNPLLKNYRNEVEEVNYYSKLESTSIDYRFGISER
ncbi:MAG: hypothetical protein CMB82_01915 [Flammeovirgaceae bacterium]|nr:hypothetical protein [Flammeovirgaceae bacterium]|tara:strand:- start:346 stop:582 length:237 start_codon:yes stop_codon:yes gene_type:complete